MHRAPAPRQSRVAASVPPRPSWEMLRALRPPPWAAVLPAAVIVAVAGCRTPIRAPAEAAAQRAPSAPYYDPSRDLGPLFAAVQLARVFPDGKTFADARPLRPVRQIAAEYDRRPDGAAFDLHAFVAERFALPDSTGTSFHADTARPMEEHLSALWPVLTRGPPPNGERDAASSLIPLPHRYVVPGGRFREIYYWDSYFTMLGLMAVGRDDLVRSMLDNFAWLVERFGHIPNGNRSYYLSRSQPPFFAAMVELYPGADTARALPYLDALEDEHAFWMDGAARLAPGEAHRRVVRLPEGGILNRYWDDRADPRPESYREDVELAARVPEAERAALWREIRATAESGWDFSSRWRRDAADPRSIETTAVAPVDLNALLFHTERTIATLRAFRGRPGDAEAARRFAEAADARRRTLRAASFDAHGGWFHDVRWRSGARVTGRPTLAAVVPLAFGLATPEEARAVAARLERDFLRPGGFVTTLVHSGEQWDAPNGWAPLQWMAIAGLRRYGFDALADTAAARWLALNQRTWRATGRMMEKYDVEDPARLAGGGEYPAQDGFGWTNGVALALMAQR